MGSSKKRLQSKAEGRASEAVGISDQRAQELKDRLSEARSAAAGMSVSGGFDPEQVNKIRETYGEAAKGYGAYARGEGEVPGYYRNFAETGGFSPEEKENFIRRATGVVPAMYARQKDESSRRLALQGGYMPGFTSSQARLTRQGAQEGAKATLGAQVDLADQIRTGKFAGIGGLESTQKAGLGGLTATALAQSGLERDLSTGRLKGLELMNDTERISISNTLAQMGVRQDEIDNLLGIDRNKRGAFGMTLDAVNAVSGAVGAGAGAYGAIKR